MLDKYYIQTNINYLKFLIPKNSSVLDLGCGDGTLLNLLNAKNAVGVDFNNVLINAGKLKYPNIHYISGDFEDPLILSNIKRSFDVILLSDVLSSVKDVQVTFQNLIPLCNENTRIIIAFHYLIGISVLRIFSKILFKSNVFNQNNFTLNDINYFLILNDYEIIHYDSRILMPWNLYGIGTFINSYIATLPIIKFLCSRRYVVARPILKSVRTEKSTSIIIPCRNEKGNIESAIKRIPQFCKNIEIIFVEGHSSDGTLEELERVKKLYEHYNILVTQQDGNGKGDAVRKGFELAKGDILIILDADLTVAPEDLPKFYNALNEGTGEFINGTRMIYPMEGQAMQFLNYIANTFFSWLFSWLINQRITDTLCGTKALTKYHYNEILKNRNFFGDFDPFGDFDLLFGAAKLNLKIVEVPIRYSSRIYGSTQISRFQHGWLLLKMVIYSFKKFKVF
jgi:SAM-dependent methyltransferase